MRIVVLDGYALNPGDLSWSELEALGTCEIHDRTPPPLVVGRARDAQIVLTNKVELGREQIDQLPDLQYIGLLATGFNIVNIEAARQRGIPVTNVPIYGSDSVAQMVFAHLLNFTQRVAHHGRAVVEGRWSASEDFCFWDYPLIELAGLTMGIVGFGRIGRATARLAAAFGMRVIACDAVGPSDVPEGVEIVELDELFRTSDVVSLHCPLTPDTEKLVDRERLAWMKETAFLINTSRGPLIDQRALAEALNEDRLAGAGLDVLTVEPPELNNPLLTAKNCVITPHIAWATKSARSRLLGSVVSNIKAFLDGHAENVVNP